MTDEQRDAPSYRGQSMAIHAYGDDPSPPPPDRPTGYDDYERSPSSSPPSSRTLGAGQVIEGPSIHGSSMGMRTRIDSPSWFDDILGYIFDGPQIHGKSMAIHVHGEPVPLPPVPPYYPCDCEDASENIPDSMDEFNRSTPSVWGTSTAGDDWTNDGTASFFVDGTAAHAEGGHTTDLGEVVEHRSTLDNPYEFPLRWIVRWQVVPADTGAPAPEPQYIFTIGPAKIRYAPVPDPEDLVSLGSADITLDINNELGSRYSDWHFTRFEADATGWRHRTWFEGDEMPADWQFEESWEFATESLEPSLGLRCFSSNEVKAGVLIVDWIREGRRPLDCDECAGYVPFDPGYLPIFRPQIGDPTTALDAHICNLEAGAMALDWETHGGIQVWGGELIPYLGVGESEIILNGTTQNQLKNAWRHYGKDLNVMNGSPWGAVLKALDEGRCVVLAGDYDILVTAGVNCSAFDAGHAILVVPQKRKTRWLVADPLCQDYKWIEEEHLEAYADKFGQDTFGIQSPQPLVFSMTSGWALGAGNGDLLWPIPGGRITQRFGCTGFYLEPPLGDCPHFHDGVDIAAPLGSAIIASADGIVGYYGWSTTGSWMVRIDYGGGLASSCGHMIHEDLLNVGQAVTRGQVIGHVGLTGNTTGPHTHWEVTQDGTPIDPRSVVRGNP